MDDNDEVFPEPETDPSSPSPGGARRATVESTQEAVR